MKRVRSPTKTLQPPALHNCHPSLYVRDTSDATTTWRLSRQTAPKRCTDMCVAKYHEGIDHNGPFDALVLHSSYDDVFEMAAYYIKYGYLSLRMVNSLMDRLISGTYILYPPRLIRLYAKLKNKVVDNNCLLRVNLPNVKTDFDVLRARCRIINHFFTRRFGRKHEKGYVRERNEYIDAQRVLLLMPVVLLVEPVIRERLANVFDWAEMQRLFENDEEMVVDCKATYDYKNPFVMTYRPRPPMVRPNRRFVRLNNTDIHMAFFIGCEYVVNGTLQLSDVAYIVTYFRDWHGLTRSTALSKLTHAWIRSYADQVVLSSCLMLINMDSLLEESEKFSRFASPELERCWHAFSLDDIIMYLNETITLLSERFNGNPAAYSELAVMLCRKMHQDLFWLNGSIIRIMRKLFFRLCKRHPVTWCLTLPLHVVLTRREVSRGCTLMLRRLRRSHVTDALLSRYVDTIDVHLALRQLPSRRHRLDTTRQSKRDGSVDNIVDTITSVEYRRATAAYGDARYRFRRSTTARAYGYKRLIERRFALKSYIPPDEREILRRHYDDYDFDDDNSSSTESNGSTIENENSTTDDFSEASTIDLRHIDNELDFLQEDIVMAEDGGTMDDDVKLPPLKRSCYKENTTTTTNNGTRAFEIHSTVREMIHQRLASLTKSGQTQLCNIVPAIISTAYASSNNRKDGVTTLHDSIGYAMCYDHWLRMGYKVYEDASSNEYVKQHHAFFADHSRAYIYENVVTALLDIIAIL